MVIFRLMAAIACFLVGGVVILILGTWLVRTFGTSPDLLTAALHVLDKMLGEVGLVRADEVHSPLWVTILLDVLGAAVILASTYLLFKPPPETHTLSAVDEARVRTLLRSFGEWDSLGYFATRRDKSIVWNTGDAATAQAGVSYRVIGSVSLASGNPVGDPQHWGSAIEQWRAKSRAYGWSMAVMGAGEPGGAAYTEAGLTAFEIGDEAILDMRAFSLNGRAPGVLRQPLVRERHGDVAGEATGKNQVAGGVRSWTPREQREHTNHSIVDADGHAQARPQTALRSGHPVEHLWLVGVPDQAPLSPADHLGRPVARARIEAELGGVPGQQREIGLVVRDDA